MTNIVMYDSVTIDAIPANASAVAGYVGGRWPTYNSLLQRWPHAQHLSIAVNAFEHAHCLDIEPGDATPDQAPAWVRDFFTGEGRPVLYTSASQVAELERVMSNAGHARSDYLVWSAHYNFRQHICAPSVCGWPQADGTQWTDKSLGRNLDESLVSSEFFGPAADPDPHHYAWYDTTRRHAGNATVTEVQVARRYDELRRRQTPRRHPHRAELSVLRDQCSLLAGRIAAVAEEHGKGGWKVNHREWRHGMLIYRSEGKRVA